MDLYSSERNPLSLSKPFYEDITKDIPSPVSRGFLEAISKPAEAKPVSTAQPRYELASPGEIAETVGAIGEAAIRTPLQIAGAAASAIRGGSREAVADKGSFLTRIIDRANRDAEDFQKKYADNKVVIAPLTKLGLPEDITTETITRFPQQAAFSAVSAGAGLAAGLGTAAVTGPAAPIAGRAAGMAASGGAAYRMQKDNSTQQLFQKLNETSMKTAGRELTPEEWKTAYDKNEGSLVEQGIAEAIPEAIGNLVGFELFFGAAKNVFGKELARTAIGKTLEKYGAGAAGKMLAQQATEQATETWTQQWQHNIDVEMGLKPGETKRSWTDFDDLRKSNKEVFADILLLTTVMGGAALAGEHVKGKMDTKASAQLVKDVVAENKFDSIPNEFLPSIYEYAQELSDKRTTDKSLATARDAFATEMDKRGIDFDMTSKFKEYLNLDAVIRTEDATGEDVARWTSLRDEFKEKNISPDLYKQYLSYQVDIDKAVGLQTLIATGKATEPQRKEFNRLTDSIVSKASVFGFDPENIESTGGVAKGEVINKPQEPAKSAARDILLGDEPEAKRKNLTAKDILTEGDLDIQAEEDLTPEALAEIDKKVKAAGTGGARKPPVRPDVARQIKAGLPVAVAGETPEKVLDITEEIKGEKAPVETGQEQDLVKKIVDGNVEDFTFPEHYSPMDLHILWDDLNIAGDDFAAKNQPAIDTLLKEREALKPDRSKKASVRKKRIAEEIENLRAESQIVTYHAGSAWEHAQEAMAEKVVAKLKEQGIDADPDKVYDAISELSDGRMNEQGWKHPLLQQVIDSVKEEKTPAASKIKAAGTGGARGPLPVTDETQVEKPVQSAEKPKSARQEMDEKVKQYRDAGHTINDNGVYTEPEKITIPFGKGAGRTGSIDIAEGPDGKFRIGVNISKKYGDYEGSGYAPAIDGTVYDSREEALKAGIETIRGRTKGDDPKSKAALKELAAFETANISTDAAIVAPEPTSEAYAERMKNAGTADEGRKLISRYEEEFASIEREAGLENSIGKGGSGMGGRGYSTLTPKEKKAIVKNVTAKNPALGAKLQSLITDIDAAEPHWKVLLEKEYRVRGSSSDTPGKSEESTEIKAAGTGGARAPKAKKESYTAPEPKKEEKPAPSSAETKAKEEEDKSRGIKKYLLEHIDEALAARTAYENNKTEDAGPTHVIIDVPKDGKFVIVNDVEHLEKFKKNVSKMKVTAALNKLPQHSGKPIGKSTDLITKEAEAEVSDYWTKRNEWKARYEGIPAEVEAAKTRLAKYEEIRRKVDAKEITLKKLGEDANAASREDRGPDAWRDSWFGKTPKYSDLMDRIREIEKEIRTLQESRPDIEARIKEYYPGLAKEMEEIFVAAKAEAEKKVEVVEEEKITKETPPEIKAAGTGGKRGPEKAPEIEESPTDGAKPEPSPTASQPQHAGEGWEMDRGAMPGEPIATYKGKVAIVEREIEGSGTSVYDLMDDKGELIRTFGTIEEAGEAGRKHVDEAPAEEAAKADIMTEISEISDDDLDALLDMPEKKETPPKTTEEAVRSVFAAARDRAAGKIPSAKPAKALDDILDAVAKEGIEGAGEAMKGLYELFGGASLKTFPGGFDEDTYAKAKPHFEAALEHFIKVGKGLREFAETIVQQFGDAIRPYLKRFIQEKRDEVAEEEGKVINLDENTGKEEGGARIRRKKTAQEKAEEEVKKKAAAEKKAHKAAMGEFKNVGYVYDPEKLNQKIKDKPPKSAAKIILDEMLPGKLWAIDFPEGATPGVVRVRTQTQKYLHTFKEYLTESRDRLRYSSGKSIDDKIEHWLTYRGGSIDTLKEWASEYGKAMQPIIDAFNGQTSITNVIGKLQDTLLPGERFGDTETGTFARHYTEINTVEAKEKFNAIEGLLGRTRQMFYSFLTDSWHNLLADENDILLSEIDINKRGRNKTVVRSGLPDYREGVELKKTEDFQAPFGFKGVGFGEEGWINQEERNRVIPAAFDAFKDLAATIGAPDKGMSLGGELAVQFANLGHKAKGAAAAYFPTVRTINFTRDNGDGTMAHEWGHGLHDLAYMDAKDEIDAIIKTFYYVYDFDAGARLVDDLLAKDSMFLKRMVSNKKQQRIEAVKNEVRDRFEETVRKSTDYYSTAQQMDEDYTARAQEMWARAFEAYIYDSLAGKNNYLVNDFVAAGRVGGKSGVGARLVYPAGKERETFNATINHFLEGLRWEDNHPPILKDDYVTIEKANELMLQAQLQALLDQVEARYTAIWASEPSKDGYFWYRYDETSFGPMMQPDGYDGYDKAFTSEGQNGTGAVAYLTQLHPDVILDYKLSNIQYEGENPTYISKERGGINGGLSEDGAEALEKVPAKPDGGPDEGGDVRSGDRGSGADGEGGTRTPGKQRGATGSSEGDSAEGVHPSPAGNYRIIDPALNDPKSVPVRFGLNLSAVKILNLVESENRIPTDAEKDILAQYSGWGGMSELFAYEPTDAWAGKAELLTEEVTEDELRDAASSSTSSYYTPVPVGQFMWKLAQRLGFEKGVVLDPAVGANGLFLGTMPPNLSQGVALQGIEMDTLSARIASKLYGLASIENKAFQDVKKPNNRFDLTITNVPFERITPTDLKHNKGGHSLHNYFINKMLNLTAPGALSMMITTSNTMDAVGAHLTEFAGKAQLVGAIRLPSGIYSSTQVATDILVFRKNIEGGKFTGISAEEWTTAGEDEPTGLTINNYFLKHPEMVAGKLEKITGRFGNEGLRVVGEGDLQENLERIAAAFPGKIVEREAVKETKSIDDIISAPGTIKEGGAYINDKDEVCEKVDGEEVKMPVATAGEQKKAAIARGYVHILDQVRATLRAQKTETDDAVVKAEQAKLKKYYDHFVKKFGPVNDPKNSAVFTEFTDAAWVLALEEYDPDTGKVTKIADIFTKNITGIASRPDRADTDHDALAMALDEFGYPNLEYIARLRNSDVESVAKGVADKITENPETGFLETMDEYLSGNVKRKLAVAREMTASNPEYARNVSLLEAAQPPEIPSHRITARIGASWISPDHLTEFVKDKMGLRHGLHAVFNFNPVSNEWSMTFHGEEYYRGRGKGVSENKAEVQRQIAAAKRSIEATTVWGTQRMDFFELMKNALQGKRPQVTFTVDRKQYLDEVATQAAEVKLQEIQTEFARWLFADTFRADQAVKRFNDIVNTSVPMNADGSHLTFPGKSMWMVTPKEKEALGVGNALVFYPHQMNAAWKYLKNGNLYLGHEVGTGKTVTMGLIAMEAKRLRGKKKILYVTLNDSTMGQAVQEIKNLYPMANVLPVRVSTNEQRKQRSLQKIALNDFDIAIMRQQDLDRIGLSPESERVFIEEEILELREILEEAKREGARILEQDIQVQLHALEEKLKAPSVYDDAKKKNLFFDDLGIDLMIVDEAHKYKNVPYATRLTRITGLNPTGSPTAKEFFRKTQYLNAQFPKKDAIVLASGTALSNSIAEMYNIQRMLQPQEVKRQGVWSFDRWIANYGDMGSQLEWDGARGQYRTITTNRRIVNAGRMLATAYQNVDSVRAEDTPVKRPVIRGGEPQRVKVQPNQYVEDYKKVILDRCAEIEMDPKNAEFEGVPDNMLRIISNMSKVAIDQRLDHHYANTEMQQDSKVAVASKIMYRRWQEESEHKGVQLVFADMGIPGKYSDKFKYKTDDEIAQLSPEELIIYDEEKFEHEGASTGFNTYEGLKKELVKLGIPENQIAFIHDADHSNKEKKAANLRSLFKKVNAGDIRVLIGSTSKAGTGVNIQGRVSDIHHLDIWWNYSAWEQRNGRGIRAGNLYANEGMPGTYIWNYVTETTVDATRWDKVFAKGKVLNAVLGGDINLDIIEDISDETMSAKMMAAEASGDPLMATQATLLQQVQGLRFEQTAHLDVVRRSRMDLAAIPGRIEVLEKLIKDYQHSRGIMDKVTAVKFIGDERILVLEKHGKEIAESLEKAVMADTGSWTENKKAPLLVFGSHTETEVVEKVSGKEGEQKEKKVKKYAFSPLPAKADIKGEKGNPYGRRLLISGDILSSDRRLADIKIDKDKDKKATVEVKANVSRTVTEYLSYLKSSEESANRTIEELKSNEPKLQKVIDTPWAKVDELATKDRELREIEAQMAARGVSVGDPTTGVPIDKYKGIVPVIEDVADKDEWSLYEGIVYPNQNTVIGVRSQTDLSRFLKSGKFKPIRASRYNTPEALQALEGGKPNTPTTKPVAYTVIDNVTKFWVPAGVTHVTVDPVQWRLLERIVGKEGSWHYDDKGTGERYIVHVNAKGERDAFIWAKQERYVPQGVKDIGDKAPAAAPAAGVKYAVSEEGSAGGGRLNLRMVQEAFPGQTVSQDGDNFTVTLKNGAQATIYGVAEITPNAVSLRAGYKKGLRKAQFIAGSFDGFDVPGWGIIRIVRDDVKAPFTLSHESVHWLEKLGVISESDKATLNARIQKEGKWDKDRSPEENRATWLADFAKGSQPKQTVLAEIWQKIQDFINRIAGIRTADMIGRELQSGRIFEREGQGSAKGTAIYDQLPVFTITEKGLTRKPRRASNNNQEVSNEPEISRNEVVRADNVRAAGQGTDDKRKIPAPGGRVLSYVPERGTLPAVKSEPIGIWKSSRKKITSLEDAAVIARDNLFRDAQETFVTIVTDKSGKILAVNQHATGAPNQSQVYAYFAAGQILNIEGASRVWAVHNHPSGQAKLSEADLNVSSNIGDLIADAGIESMPIIAITASRYSDNMWSSEPLPPKEPAAYKLPILGRKFDQVPEGLESIGSQSEFEEFGRLYMKAGGMVLVSAQRQPVALIAIDDYSKLRPLHTEILREAEKRNAVDFMIYSPEKALTNADIDNLLSFAKNTQLEFTTVQDRDGDHYEKIKELWGAVRNSKERKVFYSVADKETDAIDSTSIFPEVNERLKAAKGVKYASLKDRAKDALVTGWEHFTRHFQHLDPKTDGAVIDVFRKFQDVPAWAKDETVRQLSGFIGRLSPQGRDVFTMNILLPDMIRDIENGILDADNEGGLPFGYKNRDQVQQDYDHFRTIAEKSTAIMAALDRRNAFMTLLTEQLIQHKLLKKEVADDPAAYFHHQVLAYMNYKENPNWGMSSRDVRTHRKGWQIGRKGSQLDYNTEYVESEFEIISQALTQIETVKSLKEIERLADIKPQLEAEAKDQNMATFRRKAFTNPLDDPLLPYRVKIAMGFQKLAKLFTTENDMGALPMEFDDVIEHIVDQEEQRRAAKEDEIEFDPVPHPRMFALLNYLINNEGPGSMPAAMIFKAIAARNDFIKQVVGKDWVTYRDMIPEGYVAHKPEAGSTFYFANSIADQALGQVLAGHRNLPDAVRQVLARGRDEEWVVKEGISKTLNEFRPAMPGSLPAKMSKDMLTTWKQWILMNPFRVIRYNINNMSGDLDIAMAYDPKIITGYFTQSFKDLWAASKGSTSETLMDELSELTKRGVIGSGMTAMDIPEFGDVKSVKGLVDFFDGKSKNALSRWYSMNKKLSTLRENILRLAANRYFMDRLSKGEIVYGASRKEEVDAIENREDRAAKLARELIGDYGNISHAGQYIRERMIPFYSWLEINAPRYVRLFRNLRHEGGGGIGAMGGVLAWKATKLAVKASALMGLVMLWNAAFFPDEEDELQETGREQLHLILGRRADGSIITIRFQGALSDALSWFGMNNPIEQARKVVKGTKSVGDLAKDVVGGAPVKLFQGFRPEPKLLYETLSGQSFFPDPMHPRPIRDTTEHILRTFSLDRIYNQVAGKPKQGGSWATQMYRDIQSLAFNESDPGEQAYYTSRKYIFDWLDKQGKEKPAAMPTNRSNSLYYYKQALKFGDFDAAEKYLKKYQGMGGKLHDVQGSIRRVHPLASLRLADRYKFKASLSPEQQKTLSVATAWYKKHYVDTYQEQRKRGM